MSHIDTFEDTTIQITMTCARHYIPEFIALLQRMQANGNAGHSEWLAIFSDGDGAMRPKFKFNCPEDIMNAAQDPCMQTRSIKCKCYDAG